MTNAFWSSSSRLITTACFMDVVIHSLENQPDAILGNGVTVMNKMGKVRGLMEPTWR